MEIGYNREKQMEVVRYKIEGDTVIQEDTRLQGMIVGSTLVSEDVLLELDGMIIGSLVLEKNSRVNIRGMVNGDVTNRGGYLAIYGMVVGKVIKEAGKTIIDPKAVVSGGVI